MPPSDDYTFNYTGTIDLFTVPVTGTYDITAFGAQGGDTPLYAGGRGAEISADIVLTAGTTLAILVGSQGRSEDIFGGGAGGGGGSFVAGANGTSTLTAVVVAGGGGGATQGAPGAPGSVSQQGRSGAGTDGGAGGSDGSGGDAGGGAAAGGGGGGFLANGGSASFGGAGGEDFLYYVLGGNNAYPGGYGGGAEGGFGGGGGGGGYSGGGGGAGGVAGGGGGSTISSTALSASEVAAAESGNGEVTIDLLCFLAGTRIATPSGLVAIDDLRISDLVLTAGGRAAPLTWIGRRSVTAAAPLDRDLHYPVRICSDAVAPGIPCRDLLVTGDHAVFIDGHLIPARMLVNGGSIRAEREMTAFTYFHLELERHDLLLAEGLAAESYLDTGNRHMFAGNNVVALASPAQVAAEAYAERGVAPLSLAPELVEPIWHRLANRAAALGFGLVCHPLAATDHNPVHLLADGRHILPATVAGDRHIFALPAGMREVLLVSRAGRPSDARPWLNDRRRLGVMVSRISMHAGDQTTDIALDGPQLGAGWHDVEGAGRWTAGNGVLALPGGAEASILQLTIAGATIAGAMVDGAAERKAA